MTNDRPDEVGLGRGLEQRLDQPALPPRRFVVHAVAVGERPQVLERLGRVHLGPDRLADEVDHPSPRPRSGEIDLAATDRHDRRAERVACRLDDEPLGDRHHVGDVGERLVQLHHRELGVVPG